jgi:hypothetical protein
MKENRAGACSCLVVAVLSLGLSIVFTVKELKWWSNFCFAIMGSALLSFVICLINYITLRKKLVEELYNGLYKFNNDTNAQLYATSNNKTAENLATVIGIASANLLDLTYYDHNIKTGLFKIENKKIALLKKIIKELEDNMHNNIYSIGQYLQLRKDCAEKNINELYAIVETLLKEKLVYEMAYDLTKMVKSVVMNSKDAFGKSEEEIKNLMCDFIDAKILLDKNNNK